MLALLGASCLILAGLVLTYQAKTNSFSAGGSNNLLNLNKVERPEQLIPALQSLFPASAERLYVARRIADFIQSSHGKLPNVGAIGRLRVPYRDVSRMESYRDRTPRTSDNTVSLLTPSQVAELKPHLVIRSSSQYRTSVLLWAAAYFSVFYLLHAFWRFRGFRGEQSILPAIHVLTGIGLILMLSLRDPLRDTLSMADFAQAVVLGAIAMALSSSLNYPRLAGRLSYIPLLGALAVSTALILFGTGPGTSDAKVNLFGFQPVEAIKILLVFFLAGYFANRWEFLRVLREIRPELAKVSRHIEIPRLEYLLPVLASVTLTLVFFFLQKDLGPALVWSCLFLAMYAVARNRAVLAGAGLALLAGGFLTGYILRYPRTVYDRVQMWFSPWDNNVRGGEQVVHSLWALATGGAFGTGLGLGNPEIMPAGHTDLILAVLGEEWGFVGLIIVYLVYAALIFTGLRIASRSGTDYGFFLALGCTLLIALEILLISGGVFDLTPLSGVVTPFLSYGGTAMLANFAVFGILAALSRDTGTPDQTRPFRVPLKKISQLLAAALVVVVAKCAYVQLLRADPIVGAGALTRQADGQRRYQYNPRLMAIARSIPRGSIYDRNGIPLATSDWKQLEQHRSAFQKMNLAIPAVEPSRDTRLYPLGAYTVHLLGDLRTRANWGARNSSLVERDAVVRLQGYNDRARVVEVPDPNTGKPTYTIQHDYRELVPLLRHRWQPSHPDVLKVVNRERDVHMTISAPLQVSASRILEAHLKTLKKQKGSIVVMDTATGDLLASVSYPWPAQMPPVLGLDDGIDELLDRARYGLYPPGSTFKIVTAMAALRADPNSPQLTYECKALPDGRVGNYIRGSSRPIRDDVADRTPHGTVDMRQGIAVSCNAYFAQLGTYKVGAEALWKTASLLGIAVANPNTAAKLREVLPQASYGQGQVVASPFQMARLAATVANGGNMPAGRWISDESNTRIDPPQPILQSDRAATLAGYMRGVVSGGTGRSLNGISPPIAGKTGTAELEKKPSHAWFIGFAPYGGGARKLAFAVLVENGQYGGSAAAPIAGDVVKAAAELGLFGAEANTAK